MSRIVEVLAVPGQGFYYCEDLAAFQSRGVCDRWLTPAITPGYHRARETAEIISIGLVLNDGSIGWGDGMGVSYAGKAGRAPVFRAQEEIPEVISFVENQWLGKTLGEFREEEEFIRESSLSPAVKYGLSQALLQVEALIQKQTRTEIICQQWDLPLPLSAVPLQGSSGEKRIENAEKMMALKLPALPHGQIDSISEQFGPRGESLLAYAQWLVKRCAEIGGESYSPDIHLDLHGACGKVFNGNISEIADFLIRLEQVVAPFSLRIESPVVEPTFFAQLQSFSALRDRLAALGSRVRLVMDEWATDLSSINDILESVATDWVHIKMPNLGTLGDSIEAVLQCRRRGVGALLGGSCIETEIAAQSSVHVALATRPDFMLAKPGMGVDEALALCRNEMNRTLAEIKHRKDFDGKLHLF